jgi:hypothetical protein
MASDGKYEAAMSSVDAMQKFVQDLERQSDAAANMDS